MYLYSELQLFHSSSWNPFIQNEVIYIRCFCSDVPFIPFLFTCVRFLDIQLVIVGFLARHFFLTWVLWTKIIVTIFASSPLSSFRCRLAWSYTGQTCQSLSRIPKWRMKTRSPINLARSLVWASFHVKLISLKSTAVLSELLIGAQIFVLQRRKFLLWILILDPTSLYHRYTLNFGTTSRWGHSATDVIGAGLLSQSLGAPGLPGEVLLIGLTGIEFRLALRGQVNGLNHELLVLGWRRTQRRLTVVSTKILLLVGVHDRRLLWSLRPKWLHSLKSTVAFRLFVVQHKPLIKTLLVIHRYLLCASRICRRELHLHHTLMSRAKPCAQRGEGFYVMLAINLRQDITCAFGIMVVHTTLECLLLGNLLVLVLNHTIIWFLTWIVLATFLKLCFKPCVIHRWRLLIPALICRMGGHCQVQLFRV